MSQGPNPFLVLWLWWLVWLDLPRCEGTCEQANKPCDCKEQP